jgi:hypothetical protein
VVQHLAIAGGTVRPPVALRFSAAALKTLSAGCATPQLAFSVRPREEASESRTHQRAARIMEMH